MIQTKDTYRKLTKVYEGETKKVYDLFEEINTFPKLTKCTRGMNDIYYFRPDGGYTVNDKVYMIHFNGNGTASFWM